MKVQLENRNKSPFKNWEKSPIRKLQIGSIIPIRKWK